MNESMDMSRAMEQAEAAMDHLARIVVAYHDGLKEGRLSDELVMSLTLQFAHMWLHKHLFNESPFKYEGYGE